MTLRRDVERVGSRPVAPPPRRLGHVRTGAALLARHCPDRLRAYRSDRVPNLGLVGGRRVPPAAPGRDGPGRLPGRPSLPDGTRPDSPAAAADRTRATLQPVKASGMTIELSFGGGGRLPRPRSDRLRNAITRHRRAWAAAHLDRWLEHRWQSDLRRAAEAYNRRLLANGKPPTVRQAPSLSRPSSPGSPAHRPAVDRHRSEGTGR